MTDAPDPGDDPLIDNIRLLANRVTLAESIIRRLKTVVIVLGVMVVAGVAMTAVVTKLYADVISTRSEARAGVCITLNDMRVKHNHLVQTAIDERQRLIDATDAGSGTDEQKARSRRFFEAEIENYRTDVLEIIDCDNPAAVKALFTKPGG